MYPIVVIREYSEKDAVECKEILMHAAVESVRGMFIAALFKEITYELMVLGIALSFIFLGVPLQYCIAVVPVVIILIYILIYSAHFTKGLELSQEVNVIPNMYKEERQSKFFVAEAYLNSLTLGNWKEEFHFLPEMPHDVPHLKGARRRIIGTIAILPATHDRGTAWLRRLAVHPDFRRHHVGTKLVQTALQFCSQHMYCRAEATATECNDGAREVFIKCEFDLHGMYHRYAFGLLALLAMHKYSKKINVTKSSLEV